MSKKSLYLLGILLTIIIGTYLYCKLCDDCCNTAVSEENNTENTFVKQANTNVQATTSYPFSISDSNGSFSFSSNDNFNFDISGFSFLKPISSEVDSGIEQLSTYLSENTNKQIDVTGLYAPSEENTSAYPNLGLARANSIKNYFVTKGISSAKINTFGKLFEELHPDRNIYKGPVNYSISTMDETGNNQAKDELKLLRDKIKANPLILYFATAQSSIDLSEAQRQKIADISRYLDKTETEIAVVTGHTDNSGSYTTNLQLGKKRAEFAKNYLIQNGIPEGKIKVTSSGPNAPIDTNETEVGRTKNRRTVITIN